MNQLIAKLATSTEVYKRNTDEGSGSKAKKHKFQDVWMSEFSWLIDDSSNDIRTNMCCYVCRKAGPGIAGKTEFVTGKKFKCELIVYHNRTKSLKYENCFNVVHVSEKVHSSNKLVSIFCLIQGIYNYVQINTYWRYIVRIMASNIFLLASKKCFLTSQGLVDGGMNCRALECKNLTHNIL